ncbi:hypothetical protein [Microvirga zambiensis]|uniref:hypothetical protein n=1 Tax=Microvirga zambiensis TaxID=1402137 RepID=UPI00191E2B5E|nr:hypothetical protein [Microvirga zambiensis]
MKVSEASVKKKNSLLGGGLKVLGVLAVAASFALASESAYAAHPGHEVAAKQVKGPTSVVAKDVETTSSIETNSAGDPSCSIARKRLFVEGEGWIVRRVATCY